MTKMSTQFATCQKPFKLLVIVYSYSLYISEEPSTRVIHDKVSKYLPLVPICNHHIPASIQALLQVEILDTLQGLYSPHLYKKPGVYDFYILNAQRFQVFDQPQTEIKEHLCVMILFIIKNMNCTNYDINDTYSVIATD